MADKEVKGVPFSKYEADETKENEGVWMPFDGPFEVLVARMNNQRFQEFFLKDGVDTEAPETMRQAAAETILLGWRGSLDDEGKEVPYSVEEALKRFNRSSEFYNRVIVMSNRRENYQFDKLQEAAGN